MVDITSPDHWKNQTCEECEYRSDYSCAYNPPQSVKGGQAVHPIIKMQDSYAKACGKFLKLEIPPI